MRTLGAIWLSLAIIAVDGKSSFDARLRSGRAMQDTFCVEADPTKAPEKGWQEMVGHLRAAEASARTRQQKEAVYSALSRLYACWSSRTNPRKGSPAMLAKQHSYELLLFELDPGNADRATGLALQEPTLAGRLAVLEKFRSAVKQRDPEVEFYIATTKFFQSPTDVSLRETLAGTDFSKIRAFTIANVANSVSDTLARCSRDDRLLSILADLLYSSNEMGMAPPVCKEGTKDPCAQARQFFRSIDCQKATPAK